MIFYISESGKNNDYLDYLDHNRASTSQFASNFARICPPGTSVSAGPSSKIGGKFESKFELSSSSIPLNIKPRPAASSNSGNHQTEGYLFPEDIYFIIFLEIFATKLYVAGSKVHVL